jgi:cytoskeletal protein CcmA (bactofilin family)
MIRMGRSAANEDNGAKDESPVQAGISPIRAVSESESMARDIKEGRLSGYVGHGTTLTGETHFQSILRVDGELTGRLTSESGTLIVGSTGRINANIMVASAIINGVINGDIVAMERLEIGRSARVIGNIQAPVLVMEEGAILEGGCSMIKARENSGKRGVENAIANGLPEKRADGANGSSAQ